MIFRRYASFIPLLFLPVFVHAEVLISEIAWMGSDASHADEWIELYNQSNAPVDLTGWTLTDGDSLEIALEGSMTSHELVVLERTDDNSAPGSAFLMYTGALGNDGATLTLRRDDGSVEDEVIGGDGWENIGGDNETKETAQLTVDSGWVTAPPTPGAANETIDFDEETEEDDPEEEMNDDTDTSEDNDDDPGDGEHISMELPDNELQLTVDAPAVGYAGQPVEFVAEGSGIGESLIDSLNYRWNFGDTYTAEGKEVAHSYPFPGEYTVVLEAAYARHEAMQRHTISILPMELALERDEDGTILLQNETEHEMDIGGLTLVGDKELTIPEYTILASGATLKIARERLENGARKMVGLYDNDGALAASVVPSAAENGIQRNEPESARRVVQAVAFTPAEDMAQADTDAEPPAEPSGEETDVKRSTNTLQAAAVSAQSGVSRNERLPYLFLAGIILLGLLAIYSRRWSS